MKTFNTFSACAITCVVTTLFCYICMHPVFNSPKVEECPTFTSIFEDNKHYNILTYDGEKYITDVTNKESIHSEQEWVNIKTGKIVSTNSGLGLDSYDLLNVIMDINKKRKIKRLMDVVK